MSGAAAANVAVNGAAVEVGPNVFRYFLSKRNEALDYLFKAGGAGDPRNTVRVEFIAGSFANIFGATNKAETESFYVQGPLTVRLRAGARGGRRRRAARPLGEPRRARSPARR